MSASTPSPQTGQRMAPQAPGDASKALQAVLSHSGMSLEQKIDAFKKLRHDNRISEQTFQQILTVLAKYHANAANRSAAATAAAAAAAAATADANTNANANVNANANATTNTNKTNIQSTNTASTFKDEPPADDANGPPLSAEPSPYPMSETVTPSKGEPQPWPNVYGQRPTLTGGVASGLITGTPTIISRGQEDHTILLSGDLRHGPKKNPVAEQSMRRTIQDLVSSIDPNVKVVAEVEDLLLEIADEFIDSVANFSCRLAKHRGGDTLETRDLQLHLERNHNIRIPGFASDETRLSISQSAALLPAGGAQAAKKSGPGTHMTLRSARLNAVNTAKRDNKLM